MAKKVVKAPQVLTQSGRVTLASATGKAGMYPVLRLEDTPRMVEMSLSGKSYKDIALILKKEKAEQGIEYNLSAAMVQRDVEAALVEYRASQFANTDKIVNTALAQLGDIYQNLDTDYQRSRKVDSKSAASMLRTLIGAGMTYEEAKAEIDAMDFAGSADIQRAKMENITRRLNILGVNTAPTKSGATENNSQKAASIVNYNIKAMDKDMLKNLVKQMQNDKYSQMVEESVDEQKPSVEARNEARNEDLDLGLQDD